MSRVKNSIMGSDGNLYEDGMLVDQEVERRDLEVINKGDVVVNGKLYSSSLKGRIVNVSINGEIKSSLTECIVSMKDGWNNKSIDAIRMWNRVNSKLSGSGKCEIELEGQKFVFELIKVESK